MQFQWWFKSIVRFTQNMINVRIWGGVWNDTSVVSMYLVYSSHVITPLVNSSMYSYVMHRQVERMDTLNLFIESH